MMVYIIEKKMNLMNQEGISLLQVMALAGVMSLIILSIQLANRVIIRTSVAGLARQEFDDFTDIIDGIISDVDTCTAMFMGNPLSSSNTTSKQSIKLPYNYSINYEGLNQLTVNATYGNFLKIKALSLQVTGNLNYSYSSGTTTYYPIKADLYLTLYNLARKSTSTLGSNLSFGSTEFEYVKSGNTRPSLALLIASSGTNSVIDSCIPPSSLTTSSYINSGWTNLSDTTQCKKYTNSGSSNGFSCDVGYFATSATYSIVSGTNTMEISSYYCCKVNAK